jgi:hypothetical protein
MVCGKEIVYLHSVLNDFGFEQVSPTLFYEVSRAVIPMDENPVNRKALHDSIFIENRDVVL